MKFWYLVSILKPVGANLHYPFQCEAPCMLITKDTKNEVNHVRSLAQDFHMNMNFDCLIFLNFQEGKLQFWSRNTWLMIWNLVQLWSIWLLKLEEILKRPNLVKSIGKWEIQFIQICSNFLKFNPIIFNLIIATTM